MMRVLYSLIVVAIIFSFILYDDFADLKFRSSALTGDILSKLIPYGELRQKIYELEKENEILRAEIFQASISSFEEVKVYSSYPFNSRKDISIAGGKDKGFREGDAVTLGNKVFIGKITDVMDSLSIVKTIYDPGWEIAVRIGEKEVDGLLKGGVNPQIDFIKNEAEIKEGDLVVTASPDLPYGLEVGQIKSIKDTPGAPLKGAEVILKIQLNELRNVSVYR